MKTTESCGPVVTSSNGLIPLIVPEVRGNEWAYVKDCLDTAWVSSVGSYVDRFEQLVAQRVGTKKAVATASGTAALHIALLVAGVKPDDEVLVSTLTFIAPANAIRYVGAWPVFIDSAPDFWQMDPVRVADFLEHHCVWNNGRLINRRTRRRVSAILPVHILGHPVDMDPILDVARKYGLMVIEDATEGLAAQYRGQSVGHLADIACFSFNGNKIITTGGGGMLVTDRLDWADRAKYLTTQAKDDAVEYIHGAVGFNYRLTNVQAAIGCGQMEQLDAYVARKREIALIYDSAFKNIPGVIPMSEASWAFSTFWMYTILIENKGSRLDSRKVLNKLQQARIQTRPLWQPIHRSPAHLETRTPSCPVADHLYATALSLPCSVGLSTTDQRRVVDELAVLLAVGESGSVDG